MRFLVDSRMSGLPPDFHAMSATMIRADIQGALDADAPGMQYFVRAKAENGTLAVTMALEATTAAQANLAAQGAIASFLASAGWNPHLASYDGARPLSEERYRELRNSFPET